jgi:hypothetical protein
VPLGVVEEQVEHRGGGDDVGLRQVGRVGRHQLVEGVEDRLRGVPAGPGLFGREIPVGVFPEADLLAVVLDVPGRLGRAVSGLGLIHGKPPVEHG